jgi:predicted HTH transcriptional regulator
MRGIFENKASTIYALIREHPGITSPEICGITGFNHKTVNHTLLVMAADGYTRREQSVIRGRWTWRYYVKQPAKLGELEPQLPP